MPAKLKLTEDQFDAFLALLTARKEAAETALTQHILAYGHNPVRTTPKGQQQYWKHYIGICKDLIQHAYQITEFGNALTDSGNTVNANRQGGCSDDSEADRQWLEH